MLLYRVELFAERGVRALRHDVVPERPDDLLADFNCSFARQNHATMQRSPICFTFVKRTTCFTFRFTFFVHLARTN